MIPLRNAEPKRSLGNTSNRVVFPDELFGSAFKRNQKCFFRFLDQTSQTLMGPVLQNKFMRFSFPDMPLHSLSKGSRSQEHVLALGKKFKQSVRTISTTTFTPTRTLVAGLMERLKQYCSNDFHHKTGVRMQPANERRQTEYKRITQRFINY